ncbi:MAG TPA: Gfo/Idh/MocA family oxidoreductase [Anaerolineaceae bacterium]|nr:Gfo/Idh/MocA family oxidoreductase [Anaerolineaceae bacterium]
METGVIPRNGKLYPPIAVAQGVETIRIGVIGCGYWGPKLARNFNELPQTSLVAISDMRPDRLSEMRQLYPETHTTPDYHELLGEGIDAIVVATPVHTHYCFAKEALLAGKHVFVEKPLATNSSQACELVQLASELNKVLMVGHTFVYNPAVEAVREIVHSGQLGNLYYLNATRANLGLLQPDINVMWDLAPHDISMLSYILNTMPYSVSARGAAYVNKHRKLHEVVYLNILFEGGIMGNLRLSWLDPVKQRSLTIVGSQKMLLYDDIAENKVTIFDKGVDVYPYSITEEQFRASYRHGGETVYPLVWREPLQIECEHFSDCIRSEKQPRSNGMQGVNVIKVLETAQRSLQNGGVELLVEY